MLDQFAQLAGVGRDRLDEGRPGLGGLAARGRELGGEDRRRTRQDEAVHGAHQAQREHRLGWVRLVTAQHREQDLALGQLARALPEQLGVERRAEVRAGVGLEPEQGGEGLARVAQNIRPPSGTSAVGRSRITRPSSSGTPSTSTSDLTGPIWRAGKLTTATTRLPSSSSRE